MKFSGNKKSPCHSVSIATKGTSCEAARALRGTRFLSAKSAAAAPAGMHRRFLSLRLQTS
jgi:hypothetical protein